MNYAIFILGFFLSATFFSCDRINRKRHEITRKTKAAIKDKKDAAVDKVLPTFDSYEPDTKFNKKRFQEFFGFAPTSDVDSIYCFDDRMGIDSRFLFAFKCRTATIDKIINHLHLTKGTEPDNTSSGLWQRFPWWNSSRIMTLTPYWSKGEHKLYRYLWFDAEKGMAYYIEFDT